MAHASSTCMKLRGEAAEGRELSKAVQYQGRSRADLGSGLS
jgi:hypothetical protein